MTMPGDALSSSPLAGEGRVRGHEEPAHGTRALCWLPIFIYNYWL